MNNQFQPIPISPEQVQILYEKWLAGNVTIAELAKSTGIKMHPNTLSRKFQKLMYAEDKKKRIEESNGYFTERIMVKVKKKEEQTVEVKNKDDVFNFATGNYYNKNLS